MPQPYIAAIGTAVPGAPAPQQQIASFMIHANELQQDPARRLTALYRATGIKQRHSVLADYQLTPEQYQYFPNTPGLEPFPTVAQRMQWYRQHALPLSQQAVQNCLAQLPPSTATQITHLITVSCTGMYAPGLDIELVQALKLPSHVQRTAINFMGCYGAFPALKAAYHITQAQPQAKVLVVCTELCTLHFQKGNDDDNLLANSLFADGSAAVLVQAQKPPKGLAMLGFHAGLATEGQQDMAWNIGNLGFEMRLSAYVPQIIKKGIGQLTQQLRQNLNAHGTIHHYAIHPGGKKILQAIEQALGISTSCNQHAYHILKNFGNMSSPTVLFVLQQLLQNTQARHNNQKVLSLAFGPGLTLESALFSVIA